MRLHYLQHVPFEDIAHIGVWAHDKNHSVSGTELFSGQPLPETSDFDFLVVMGGPMGVHDTREYEWMVREKRFIEQALNAQKPVLGICLGAQLIADVCGAKVHKNGYKEIGWHPLTRVDTAMPSPITNIVPDRFYAFHWHGDTFEIPEGAVHFAQNDGCANQAFFLPPCTLGLQFHLESTGESIDKLIQNCGNEMVAGLYVQTEQEIRSQGQRIEPSNRLMDDILDAMGRIA